MATKTHRLRTQNDNRFKIEIEYDDGGKPAWSLHQYDPDGHGYNWLEGSSFRANGDDENEMHERALETAVDRLAFYDDSQFSFE